MRRCFRSSASALAKRLKSRSTRSITSAHPWSLKRPCWFRNGTLPSNRCTITSNNSNAATTNFSKWKRQNSSQAARNGSSLLPASPAAALRSSSRRSLRTRLNCPPISKSLQWTSPPSMRSRAGLRSFPACATFSASLAWMSVWSWRTRSSPWRNLCLATESSAFRAFLATTTSVTAKAARNRPYRAPAPPLKKHFIRDGI
ncbi:hypothetical protein SDC9_95619 [bioreactor metagenome]|uniref:Uncharacterized protein n=1 Tax=bioreactor metagenome TaxID=1076179 RepID=A0A645A712_9ZZZZ